MLVFKRMRMNNDLRVGAPPGSPVEISESGYMTTDNLNEHKASETHEDVENEEPNETNEEPIITEANVDNEILWPELPSPQESLATTNTPTTKKPTEASPRLKISIDSISPIPIPKPHPESKKGTAQKAVVLTDSPYKKELELAKQLQLAQEHVKELKIKLGKVKPKSSMKRVSDPNIKLEGKPIYKKNKEAVKRNFEKKKCENPTKPVLLNAASSSKQADIVVEMCVDKWFCSICEENKLKT
ncbi:hypothetical protein J6590_069625 [Homalodisca vitripennis]|nr:hypothetical protein J6590_069625 [Homalodisca vitripennis]